MDKAFVWALLYSRAGDNSQAVALAQSLGLPFETKLLRYNRLRSIGRFFGPSFATLDRPSRDRLGPPWPDAVIAIGRWSVPIARSIRRRSGGRTKIIFLGNPRTSPRHFDLIIATRDYLHSVGGNVVTTALPLVTPPAPPTEPIAEPAWAASLPHPRSLLLIGGSVKYFTLSPTDIGLVVNRLARTSNARGGSVLVCASPRTPDALIKAAELALAAADHGYFAPARTGGLASLFACADDIFVTGDSMSMTTEAIHTGKPVGVLPLRLSARGRRKLGPVVNADGRSSKRRDLRRFWNGLWADQLAGTLVEPRSAPAGRAAGSFAQIAATARSVVQQPIRTLAARERPELADQLAAMIGSVRRTVGTWSLAARDTQTPWYAKVLAGASTLLAISPIDFTPDSIPWIGHLDDPILMIIGTLLAIGFVPTSLRAELRRRAAATDRESADHGAMAIGLLWAVAGVRLVRLFF